MQIKSGLLALGAITSLMFLVAPATEAKSANTDKKKDTKDVKIVKVKRGDTLEAIAKKHDTTYVRLFNANKSIKNPNMIDVGDKVRVPKKGKKLPNRYGKFVKASAPAPAPTYTAPATYSAPTQQYAPSTASTPTSSTPSYSGGSSDNTYYKGYCTWYVKNQRPDLPNMLGNGGQWGGSAKAKGYTVNSNPSAGAVAEQAGHVAYVESVNRKKGTVTVSEMNYTGFNEVSSRTVPASTFTYIH